MIQFAHNEKDLLLLYRTFARSLPDTAVFVYDSDLRVLLAEGRALIPPYTTESLEGRLMAEVLPDTPTTSELMAQYRRTFEGIEISREYRMSMGRFLVHSLPVRDEGGVIVMGMTIARNVETQLSVESALRHNERRIRTLLNTLPDELFVITLEGIYTQHHHKNALTPHKNVTIGQDIRDTHLPSEVIQQTLAAVQVASQSQHIQTFTYSLPEGDGFVYYEARVASLSLEEALILVRDVTPLRQTQEALQQHVADLELLRLFDKDLAERLNLEDVTQITLDLLIRLTNANLGVIALCDESALQLAHHVGALEGQVIQQRLKKAKNIYNRCTKRNTPRLILDWGSEGTDKPLLPTAHASMILPLVNNERHLGIVILETEHPSSFTPKVYEVALLLVTRTAASIENAHLYNKTEQQLAEMRALYDHVRQLEQIKTDMIRIASHDLKNPLAGILGYVEILRRNVSHLLDEGQKAYITHIDEAARRMQRMVSGILSLERIEQMSQNQASERVLLTSLVAQVVAEYEFRAKQAEQTLEAQIVETPLYVLGDPFQLREAIRNLLSNALKYTPQGGQVRVYVQQVGENVQVRVQDTGYGIPQAMQAELFKPFYRARTAETNTIEGVGLGLHLVKNIIERHKGVMFVHSVYREGSNFGFDLRIIDERARLSRTRTE